MSISFDRVEKTLRQNTFGTLSTLTEDGAPHVTGVVYWVAAPGEPLNLYVTTRTTNRKVRNFRARPEVAFVVPAPHRFFPVFPPRAIQFLGTATIGCGRRRGGNRTFEGSWFLRRILATERRIVTEGGRLCFNRIRPNRTVFTYAIGMTVWDNLRQPRGAIGRVTIPESGR